MVSLKSKDGTSLLKDPAGITQCWHENFSDLFSVHYKLVINNAVIDSLPLHDIHHIYLLPTLEEVCFVLQQTYSRNAPGLDGVPADLLQYEGKHILSAIDNMITVSWERTPILLDLVDGNLIYIFKGKRTKSKFDYCSSINLEAVDKALIRLLLNKLMEYG